MIEGNNMALVGGTIITMDDTQPTAHGVLIENGRIARMGDAAMIMAEAARKRYGVVNLHGAVAVPGLHDCHVHVMGTGTGATGADLYDAHSIAGVLKLLEGWAKRNPNGWVYGTRLDESRLNEKRPPTAAELDAVFPDRGVYLLDRGLHYTQMNTIAFEAIGYEGTESGICLGEDEKPNGRVHGEANGMAKTYCNNTMTDDQRAAAIKWVAKQAAAKGVTTIHAMEGGALFSDSDIPVFDAIHDDLPVDIKVYWDTLDVEAIEARGYTSMGTDVLLDGSIGSRTAAFDTPYADDPTTKGVLYYEQDEINKVVKHAIMDGIQTGFHCIGSRGIRMALDALEYGLGMFPVKDHRFRLEHFGFPDAADIERAAEMGAIVSTQPAFSYLRGGPKRVYNQRLGDEREQAGYDLRRYADAGLLLCGGSDSSVTPIDPILGIHAAVNPPYANHALTAKEALEMFTTNAAFAGCEEQDKGSITVGKFGDITILSDNPLTVPGNAIKDITVEATILRGNLVYSRG